MPFIPHTDEDVAEMLSTISAKNIDVLFKEIPDHLKTADFSAIPEGVSEHDLSRLMHVHAHQIKSWLCFIGAGAYEHHIPGAVWDIATRGEFMTAYTPYQPEASQGSLQLMYEYQTMMASLMGLDVANASLYDGASGLAEAILMGMRLSKAKINANTILLPKTIHPHYRKVVETIVGQNPVHIAEVDYDLKTGQISVVALEEALEKMNSKGLKTRDAILVLPQPNFFGVLEDTDQLTDWAKQQNILVIGTVNPLAMALLKPPGQWGKTGADIACGEGQPLGIPLSCGGPYYGFLCCKKEYIRQMPGRIVGRTTDLDGKEGFVLTLQAREQHIRRGKATSNICTNQGLMVTASTIFMSLMGPQGLRKVAEVCHQKAKQLKDKLAESGVETIFSSPFFNEFVIRLPVSIDTVLKTFSDKNIQAGYNLQTTYPELENCLMICVTETKTLADLELYVETMQKDYNPC